MKPRIKITDILIIMAASGIVFLSAFSVYVKPAEQTRVMVRGQKSEWSFPADADETVAVPGPLGDTVIRISANSAWVVSSPCDNQTCVAAGRITRQGQWAACLPNSVLLMMYGKESEDADTYAW